MRARCGFAKRRAPWRRHDFSHRGACGSSPRRPRSAVTRACAPTLEALEKFLQTRAAKLEPGLVRRANGLPYCHIFYTPTVPGFRASAEDEPITGVFGALDPARFIAGRAAVGDGLSILGQVLEQAPGPVRVTLTINRNYDPRHWPAAVKRHFGRMPHQVETRPSRA
ncbi:MAG: hypothetical protein R2724_24095 [Bryobacterales bacterium]